MMDKFLAHLVDLTGHRDHTRLDISLLIALHQLAGAAEARTLEFFTVNTDLFFRQRVAVQDGQVIAADEDLALDQDGEPITHYPGLAACIDARLQSGEENSVGGLFILWFPIWINDRLHGCVQVTNAVPFNSHARDVIEGMIGVYRNHQCLLDYSERDSLTGLLNRKTFDEKFARMVASTSPIEIQSATELVNRRQPAGASEQWLAVIDIDHFKKVNDQFGHLYGDEVLILVANLLRASFRAQDRVFRFGGEEFVVLLRSVTLNDARKIFERFRRNIEQHEFPQVGHVTVSVGFAGIAEETPVVILGHADRALYYAKENGRNQVCYYDELVQNGLVQAEHANDSAVFFFD